MNKPIQLGRREFQQLLTSACLLGLAGCQPQSEGSPKPQNAIIEIGDDLKRANNQFAIQFLKSIENDDPGKNQFLSPFSIESALLMTLEGARGRTAQEMQKTLGLPAKLDSVRKDLQGLLQRFNSGASDADGATKKRIESKRAELETANARSRELMKAQKLDQLQANNLRAKKLADEINSLAKTVDQYDLRVANGLWAEQTCPFEADFLDRVKSAYAAGVENVDFKKSFETQRNRINSWIADHTEQKIKDLIPDGALSSDTRLVLANAIYFRGTWEEPFEEAQTKAAAFFDQQAKETQVKMMNKFCESASYAAFNIDGTHFETPRTLPEGSDQSLGYPKAGFQMIELTYNGGDLSMVIMLPTKNTTLAAIVESLSATQLEACVKAMKIRDFRLQLPKFKLESTYNLNAQLEKLGMKIAFDPNSADFSGMSREQLFISKVLHKAFVDVNEKGTEAAAATAVLMAAASAPLREIPFIPQFVADHPFLFLIRHRQSDLILFLGKVESL